MQYIEEYEVILDTADNNLRKTMYHFAAFALRFSFVAQWDT